MSHFGVLSYKGSGHLNPLIALSKELIVRGHRVTFFLPPELEQHVRQHGIDFHPIEAQDPADGPKRVLTPNPDRGGGRTGDSDTRLDRTIAQVETFLRKYPPAISASGVDALIMGEISLAGPTVAELLRVPYFVVSTSIPHNFGWNAPRSIFPRRSTPEDLQNKQLEVSIFNMRGPVMHALDRCRLQLGLGSIRGIESTFPELAHITQWPQCLDISRTGLPANFFYAGPFVDDNSRQRIDFPWDQLTGQPLVYVSLGTTKKADPAIFRNIAEACAGFNLQVVITLGGRREPASLGSLPGSPLIVRNAPQLELLKLAEMVITHAGPNTVLETLLQGKPMIALPIALDQPAVAAHLARLKASEVIRADRCSVNNIRTAITRVMTNPRYRESAQSLQKQLQCLHGISRAAGIIETKHAGCSQALAKSDRAMTIA